MQVTFHTPVLLITFNRPEHTKRVLEVILAAKPKDLYVFQDGSREGNENDRVKCAEVRQVVGELTNGSDVKLYTNYSEKNLGCGPGPATAITWFFENVEMGIVMEDDCLPHTDFFGYCEELLIRYRDDERVMYISSTLYTDQWKCEGSYGFSHYMMTGAWASWRRAWRGFDLDLHDLDVRAFRRCCRSLLFSRAEYDWWYFKAIEIQRDTKPKSYWDYQMQIHLFNNKGLTIHPRVNLISNIGFDAEGTHTLSNDGRGNLQSFAILPLEHISDKHVDVELDYICFAQRRSQGFVKDMVHSAYLSMLFGNTWLNRLLRFYKMLKGKEPRIVPHV